MKYTREDALDFDKTFVTMKYCDPELDQGTWARTVNNVNVQVLSIMAYFMAYNKYDDAIRARVTVSVCGNKAWKILSDIPFEDLPLYLSDGLCKDCKKQEGYPAGYHEEGICARVAAWRIERGK